MSTRPFKFWLIFITLLGGLSFWVYSTYLSQKQITIDVNGRMVELRTHASTVSEALADAEILIEPADQVEPDLNTEIDKDMTIVVTKANHVILEVDGSVSRIYTYLTDPLQILAEHNIFLTENDELHVNHTFVDPNHMPYFKDTPKHIRVIHAKSFMLYDNHVLIASGLTTASSIGELLDEYGLTLYLADEIFPSPLEGITDNAAIQIIRSAPVTILVDEREIRTRAIGETVGDVLNRLGFSLIGQDYSIPNEKILFTSGMRIEVIRVQEISETQQTGLPYETVRFPDANLPVGEERLVQMGIEGLQETVIQIRRENNLIVSQVVQGSWVVTSPIPEIIAYGTQER